MSSETNMIQSIRDALAGGYRKPEPELVTGFCSALKTQTDALDYLKITRGFTQDTIDHFKLGYCAAKNAISIPVYKSGELVNIRYRALDPNSKMRYMQEKGCEVWLYNEEGIEKGKARKSLLIVEGEFDLMSAWQAGCKSVVSPASGKDSYGVWIEMLDPIPKVFIAYDNDEPGRNASLKMAERIGIDKSYEVMYPEGFKDANDYFLKHTAEDFKTLLTASKPYYKHKYSGVGEIIESIMKKPEPRLELDTVPFVKWKSDWVGVVTADSGFGKTTYALNIVDELANKDIPALVLPFERGVREVGERYIQVRYQKTEDDLLTTDDEEWNRLKLDSVNLPLYFSMPKQDEFFDTVRRAKRLFDIKFIVIDHLDYFIRGKEATRQQADFMHQLKEFCIEINVIALVVHHINKDKDRKRSNKIYKEDLKGSSDIYQIAEVVILMYADDDGDKTVIEIAKNKGKEGIRYVEVNMATGKFKKPTDISYEDIKRAEIEAEQAWND